MCTHRPRRPAAAHVKGHTGPARATWQQSAPQWVGWHEGRLGEGNHGSVPWACLPTCHVKSRGVCRPLRHPVCVCVEIFSRMCVEHHEVLCVGKSRKKVVCSWGGDGGAHIYFCLLCPF